MEGETGGEEGNAHRIFLGKANKRGSLNTKAQMDSIKTGLK
jgi:hypothetical protein